jgi:hypothetical protein
MKRLLDNSCICFPGFGWLDDQHSQADSPMPVHCSKDNLRPRLTQPSTQGRCSSKNQRDNHPHILVEVPKRPEVLPGPGEIVAKLKRLSGERFVGAVEQRSAMHRAAGDTAGEAAYWETFYQGM